MWDLPFNFSHLEFNNRQSCESESCVIVVYQNEIIQLKYKKTITNKNNSQGMSHHIIFHARLVL